MNLTNAETQQIIAKCRKEFGNHRTLYINIQSELNPSIHPSIKEWRERERKLGPRAGY